MDGRRLTAFNVPGVTPRDAANAQIQGSSSYPSRINGFYLNNKAYLIGLAGGVFHTIVLDVTTETAITLESQTTLSSIDDLVRVDGMAGNSTDLWISGSTVSNPAGGSGEVKALCFTTRDVPPRLTRTPIDTIFYTDKDRHKIYPKKCWIVQKVRKIL